MTLVMQQMLTCVDARLEVLTFGKTHRPEEKEKLEAATKRLRALQALYPASWQALQRFLKKGLSYAGC